MDKTLDLDELERVAREATPGPWQNGIDDLEGVVAPDNPGLGNVICIPPEPCMYSSREHWDANATYIATFDPPTTLTLIAAARPAETRDWSVFEDDIADAISDSMDMDWSSRDGARAVVAYLKQIGAKLP
jgi:hypothetical protein